jgi:catechol 2,3-dioxygenase-like lactoylglutathione lyase family enzyme
MYTPTRAYPARPVFDHVTIRASDREATEDFYDTVLPLLGIEKKYSLDWIVEWGAFSVSPATEGKAPTRGLHVGFVAPSRAEVDEFWRVGTGAGYTSDGKPGPRPQYSEEYYGSFLLDPDGNSAEAVHHDNLAHSGGIDHLWIRVKDVEASRRFYEKVTPWSRFSLDDSSDERAKFDGPGATSFSVVAGSPTENLHLAFTAEDNATVDAFHAALTDAGYEDNGGPGERPQYHDGYYGAFVLDPDGNNVEVVCHNRS